MSDQIQIKNKDGNTILEFPFAFKDAAMIIGEMGGDAGKNFGELLVTDGELFVFSASGRDGAVSIGRTGRAGSITIKDSKEKTTLHLSGEGADLFIHGNDNGSDLVLTNKAGKWRVWLRGEDGAVLCLDDEGKPNAFLGASEGHSELALGGDGRLPGRIVLRSGHYEDRVVLDAVTGDVQLVGADCAEEFDVFDGQEIAPGTLVVLDEQETIRPCSQAYDRRVIGIVSGAGGTVPGITLGAHSGKHRRPVALAGKAYCKVDASYGAVALGDLLTTSPTLGHAMKVKDHARATGSVVGKALGCVPQGSALVPTLVAIA